MIARFLGSLALGLGLAATSFSPASAATQYTNWTLTQNFRDDGSIACSLRAGAERDGGTLAVDGRVPRKKISVAPNLTFGALPPLFAGKSTTIRNVTVSIGSWQATNKRGAWSRGSTDKNSRIGVQLEAGEWSALLNALSTTSSAALTFALANGTSHTFSVNIRPDAAPAAAMAECLN